MWDFEDFGEDFGIRIGPMGISMHGLGRFIKYSRTSDTHILRIKIDPEIKKEEIKVRLVKPGLIEIEWPRKIKGEEIPVE